jgi:signal transduction histidine kinase
MFQRLHSEDDYPGTGIGLAIVKKAVNLINGQVWVDSTPGKGSVFYVKLDRRSHD